MTGKLLARGLLAGVLAGLLAFGFAKVFGEPQVDRAIAFEAQASHAHDHGDGAAEEELVSREVQASFGLFTGVMAYSMALGGLFALVFAFAMGRANAWHVGPRGLAAILAALAFCAVVLLPMLKYPANPPAVGDPDTIRLRTELFFLWLLLSIVAMGVAVKLFGRLLARRGGWMAALYAGALYLLVMSVAGALFPTLNEVPEHFSATLLWQFRVASLGIQVVLWSALGLGFGLLAERLLRQTTPQPAVRWQS